MEGTCPKVGVGHPLGQLGHTVGTVPCGKVLEIEVEGCKQIKEKVPDVLTIFIVPPSMQELEKRIRGRGTEAEEVVQK